MKSIREELIVEIDCCDEQLPLVVAALGQVLQMKLDGASISIEKIEAPNLDGLKQQLLESIKVEKPTLTPVLNGRRFNHASQH